MTGSQDCSHPVVGLSLTNVLRIKSGLCHETQNKRNRLTLGCYWDTKIMIIIEKTVFVFRMNRVTERLRSSITPLSTPTPLSCHVRFLESKTMS